MDVYHDNQMRDAVQSEIAQKGELAHFTSMTSGSSGGLDIFLRGYLEYILNFSIPLQTHRRQNRFASEKNALK